MDDSFACHFLLRIFCGVYFCCEFFVEVLLKQTDQKLPKIHIWNSIIGVQEENHPTLARKFEKNT